MNDTSPKQIHTIFGAGQIGTPLAGMLAADGHQVRLVRRSAPGAAIEGVHWMRGDATDASFAAEACRGASVVYNCANPADYHRWDGILQPLYGSILTAAARADARLVALDNLYMVGRPASVPFDESAPEEPCSRKGELRRELSDMLLSAHRRGDVRATSGRASDYFGPGAASAAIFGPRFFEQLLADKPVELLGDPDLPRSYSYTLDVARGLMELGRHEAALGRTWHLPVAAQVSTRELVQRFAAAAGLQGNSRVIPRWALRLVGLFVPVAGAMVEMIYQWEVPFVVDDSAFRRTFGVEPTALDQAVADTLASVQQARAQAA